MSNAFEMPDAVMRAKWELARVTALALEDAGLTAADIAGAVGEAAQTLQRWLDGVVHDVSLDRLAGLYGVVAERTGRWPLAWLIGGRPGDLEPSDDDLRQLLKDNGGKVIDVDAMPIAEVRELLTGMRLVTTSVDADDDDFEGITASIKHERALRRAESNLLRHGTRVVVTPDIVGGQPRIDGTRMPIAMLIIYLRSMTESEISREWSHLPPGWLDAIVAWIEAQRAPENGE